MDVGGNAARSLPPCLALQAWPCALPAHHQKCILHCPIAHHFPNPILHAFMLSSSHPLLFCLNSDPPLPPFFSAVRASCDRVSFTFICVASSNTRSMTSPSQEDASRIWRRLQRASLPPVYCYAPRTLHSHTTRQCCVWNASIPQLHVPCIRPTPPSILFS